MKLLLLPLITGWAFVLGTIKVLLSFCDLLILIEFLIVDEIDEIFVVLINVLCDNRIF